MATLQPAGLFAQIASLLFPKQLHVHVRTETLLNGQVEVTPIFTIDGHEVPARLVTSDPAQSILGYHVLPTRAVSEVQKRTQGHNTRLSKSKAAQFLSELESSGVSIRSKDGRTPTQVAAVKPSITLRLNPDDSLIVESELTTADGVIVPKPADLRQLREDDGWYSVGGDFFKVSTTSTVIDEAVITKKGSSTLAGDDVPTFLKNVSKHAKDLGTIEKNDLLSPLSVFGNKAHNRAEVDGDSDSISVATSLVIESPAGRPVTVHAPESLLLEN